MVRTFSTCQEHTACVVETEDGTSIAVHHASDGNDTGGFVAPVSAEPKVRYARLRRRLARMWRWTRRHILLWILRVVNKAAWKVFAKTAYWSQLARS